MTDEQKYLLSKLYLKPFVLSDSELTLLKSIIDKEVEMRQEVRNKELKLSLATKVQEETGNDQHLADLKADLHLARKNYAKRLSDMDYFKYHATPVPRDENNVIIGASEPDIRVRMAQKENEHRLEPLDAPRWQITTTEDDGSERVIGYS